MLRTLLAFVIICCVFTTTKAQFSDDFSDGDFTSNPIWIGNTAKFSISAQNELWLNAPAATDEAYLSTTSTAINNATWEFYTRLEFNPSSSNRTSVYLVSSSSDLTQATNGYFVMIGNTPDEISLYQQTGTQTNVLIDGPDGMVNLSTVEVKVKVTRDASGNWELFADTTTGFTGYTSLGTAFNNVHTSSSYFGVWCDYTSTRSDKFYFDDFTVTGTGFVDTTPPTVTQVSTPTTDSVFVVFSEPISAATANLTSNYSIGGISIQAAQLQANGNLVKLALSPALTPNTNYTINISGIEDLAGNAMISSNHNIQFVQVATPNFRDIVINELMPDPNPVVALPDAEFIELFNPTNQSFDLTGFVITDGTSNGVLGNVVLGPTEYLILCNASDVADFSAFGATHGLSSFPTLNNSGDNIQLFDANNNLIDAVNYSSSWHAPGFESGGVSLEQITAATLCTGSSNWTSSQDFSGGTPGTQNSVYSANPSTQAATLNSLIIDGSSLELYFSKPIDTTSFQQAQFSLSNGLQVTGVVAPSALSELVTLQLNNSIIPGTIYTLNASQLSDCSGNTVNITNYEFGLGEIPTFGELLITEIYPTTQNDHPFLPPYEFLELHNASTKIIELGNTSLSDFTGSTTLPNYTLLPGEYVIVCQQSAVSSFKTIGPTISLGNWLNLNNSGDSLTLTNSVGEELHHVYYNESWFLPNSNSGFYSLELKSVAQPCAQQVNWGVSEANNGATPGAQNTVYSTTPDEDAPQLTQASIVDSTSVLLSFNENITQTGLNALVVNWVPQLTNANQSFFGRTQFLLTISPQFEAGSSYSVELIDITDCAGNSAIITTNFTAPQPSTGTELTLNELLFNPIDNGSDFVELYNLSNKTISLKNFELATIDTDTQTPKDATPLSNSPYTLSPDSHVVIAENCDLVSAFYPSTRNCISQPNLPSYANSSGTVLLLYNGKTVDSVSYSEDWHFSLLASFDGVSLEKINPTLSSALQESWHSASESAGFATPGYLNSQAENINTNNQAFSLQNTSFSPDNDGYQDQAIINYSLPQPGTAATIEVFTVNGNSVAVIANNELLGTQGIITWNGLTYDNLKAPMGLYVIAITTYNLNGSVNRYKLPISLVGKF